MREFQVYSHQKEKHQQQYNTIKRWVGVIIHSFHRLLNYDFQKRSSPGILIWKIQISAEKYKLVMKIPNVSFLKWKPVIIRLLLTIQNCFSAF